MTTDIITDTPDIPATSGDIVTDADTPLAAQAEQQGRHKVRIAFGESENALKGLTNDAALGLDVRTTALQSVALFTTQARDFVKAGGNPAEILNAILSGSPAPTVQPKPAFALGSGSDSTPVEESPANNPTVTQLEALAKKLGLVGGTAQLLTFMETILDPIGHETDDDVKRRRLDDMADAAQGLMVSRDELEAVKAELADERNDALPTTQAGKRLKAERELAKERNADDPKSLAGKLKQATAELNADDPDTVAGKGKQAATERDAYKADLRALAPHIKGNRQVSNAVWADNNVRQAIKTWLWPQPAQPGSGN